MGWGNDQYIKDFQQKQEGKSQRNIEKVICRRRKIRIYLGIYLGYHTPRCIYNIPMVSKLHRLTPLRV